MSLPSVSNSEQKFPFTQTNFAAVGQPVPSRGSAPRRPHRGLPDREGGGGSRARSPPSGGGRAEAGPGRDGGTGRGRPARSGEPMAAVGAGGAARGRAGRERDCAGLRGCESGPGPAERCRIGSGREPEPGGGQRAGTMSQESLQGMDEGALRKLVSARTAGRGEGRRSARSARRWHRSRRRAVPGALGAAAGPRGELRALPRRSSGRAPSPALLGQRHPSVGSVPSAGGSPLPARLPARCWAGRRCPPCATRAPGLCFPLARLQQPSPPRPPASCGHPGAPGAASCRPRSVPIPGLNCCGRPGMGALVGRRSPLAQPGGGSGLRPSRGSALGSCFGT